MVKHWYQIAQILLSQFRRLLIIFVGRLFVPLCVAIVKKFHTTVLSYIIPTHQAFPTITRNYLRRTKPIILICRSVLSLFSEGNGALLEKHCGSQEWVMPNKRPTKIINKRRKCEIKIWAIRYQFLTTLHYFNYLEDWEVFENNILTRRNPSPQCILTKSKLATLFKFALFEIKWSEFVPLFRKSGSCVWK